jgi:hypothetical protein
VDFERRLELLADKYASGNMGKGELIALGQVIARSIPFGDFLVEIGAFKGRGTAFIALVLDLLGSAKPVLSVDPFERALPEEDNSKGVFADYQASIRAEGLESRCYVLTGFSRDVALLVPPGISTLVVDGSHLYENVKDDLLRYARKVSPGGSIFVDDYYPTYPGVVKALDEFMFGNSQFSFRNHKYFAVLSRL